MAFSISDFRAKTRDLARNHLFQVEILFPTSVGPSSDLVNILAKASTIPGRSIEPVDAQFMASQYKLAGAVTYSDWEVTFRLDDNYDTYKKFRAWSELVHGTESNIAAFPAQYKSNPIAYLLDQAGNRLVAITLNGAWPSTIGDLSVDTTSADVMELSVTFAYDYSTFKVV